MKWKEISFNCKPKVRDYKKNIMSDGLNKFGEIASKNQKYLISADDLRFCCTGEPANLINNLLTMIGNLCKIIEEKEENYKNILEDLEKAEKYYITSLAMRKLGYANLEDELNNLKEEFKEYKERNLDWSNINGS